MNLSIVNENDIRDTPNLGDSHTFDGILLQKSLESSQENTISVNHDGNEFSITVCTEASMPPLEPIPQISDDIVAPNSSQMNDL